jgi:hypothetical protein
MPKKVLRRPNADAAEADPDYWRDRARVLRIKADGAKAPRTKRLLRGVAEAYERLAQQLEHAASEGQSRANGSWRLNGG